MHFSCLESRVPSDHLSIPNTRGGTTLGRGSKARTGLKALIWQFLFKKSTRKIKDLQQAYARSRLDGQFCQAWAWLCSTLKAQARLGLEKIGPVPPLPNTVIQGCLYFECTGIGSIRTVDSQERKERKLDGRWVRTHDL